MPLWVFSNCGRYTLIRASDENEMRAIMAKHMTKTPETFYEGREASDSQIPGVVLSIPNNKQEIQ